jgi:signal transduction histidine kinase
MPAAARGPSPARTCIDMVLVYFVYGLAFFSMGFAIALESRQSSGFRMANSLPYLAAFGILHSLVEWSDMVLLIEGMAPSFLDMEVVRLVRTLLLGASAVALIRFGTGLLPANRWTSRLRWLPALLGLLWVATVVAISSDYPPGTRPWLIHSDIWARFLLYLPGSLLAGFGLFSEAGFLDGADFPQIARDARLAAATFVVSAIVSGLVVPPGQHIPALPVNYDSFQAIFGIPVQMVRAVAALAVAYFILRVLRLFRFETARQMEQAKLRQVEAQCMATMEERERLAREMHDGLAQVIGFLSIKTRVVQQLVADDRGSQAQSELEQMHGQLQGAYVDVRESILSLRNSRSFEMGLLAALRLAAADFTEQNGIPVELILPREGEVSFPPEAELQLVRVVRESLANVRKHAEAKKVWIRLEPRDAEAILSVEDDGAGFDTSTLSGRERSCFGLQSMKERSESIGAAFEAVSVPGEGTRIQVRYPVDRGETGQRRVAQGSAG